MFAQLLDLPPTCADVVISLTTLDHLDPTQLEGVVTMIVESLRPGGLFIGSVFTIDDPGAQGQNRGAYSSETASYVRHYFEHGELQRLFDDLQTLHYQELHLEDRSHGPVHTHAVAHLVARKP